MHRTLPSLAIDGGPGTSSLCASEGRRGKKGIIWYLIGNEGASSTSCRSDIDAVCDGKPFIRKERVGEGRGDGGRGTSLLDPLRTVQDSGNSASAHHGNVRLRAFCMSFPCLSELWPAPASACGLVSVCMYCMSHKPLKCARGAIGEQAAGASSLDATAYCSNAERDCPIRTSTANRDPVESEAPLLRSAPATISSSTTSLIFQANIGLETRRTTHR